jgi:hypothetical protein
MITARPDSPLLEGIVSRPTTARAVMTLARVEGRRLIRHPAIVVTVALAVVQTAPFLLSADPSSEHNVGWLLQVSALVISFGAFLAANLQAVKSRRDGSEELFQAAPLSPAARTLAMALSAVWVVAALALLLLAGDIAIREAGKGAANDSGQALFPLFDLVQGPLMAGLFVVIGIAVARWFPWSFAGPIAVVTMFVAGTSILNAAGKPAWMRLTPFDPSFLDDGGLLAAFHAMYLCGLAAVVLAVALLRFGWTRWVRTSLAGGLAVATISGAFQLAS